MTQDTAPATHPVVVGVKSAPTLVQAHRPKLVPGSDCERPRAAGTPYD